MKKLRIATIVLALLFPVVSFAASKTVIPIYTPGAGGTAYLIGGAIATVMNRHVPEVQMMVEATGGTAAMSKLMGEKAEKKQPAFGIGDSKVFYQAYAGQAPFTKAISSLRSVTFIHGAELCLVVAKNSPIKSYADLKGKRVGVGAAGSGTSQISVDLIAANGVFKDMYKQLWLGYTEVAEGIKDDSIDAGFIAGTYPIPALQQLALEKDIRIIPTDQAVLKKVLDANSYFYGDVLKPNAYRGVTQETPILVFGSILETQSAVDADLVYKITKTLFETRGELIAITPQMKDMTLKNARITIATPFHPGTERYFKEAGAGR
jgi:TRAP transporter TAXI family solute receptor